MSENELIRSEIQRLDGKLERVIEITTKTTSELSTALARLTQSNEALAQRQQEFQVTQKEMAASVVELSKAVGLVQHNCEMRRGVYSELNRQVADPETGLIVQVDRVNGKFKVFWTVLGIVGTVATIALGLLGDYIMKKAGVK